MKDSNWDLDLRAGLAGESKVADLLSLDTLEVKTDRRWHETGNIYIETECWIQASQSWEPSGLRTTKATHCAYVLEDCVVIVPTYRLKEAVWENARPITCDIQPNPSKGYLITPGGLLEYVRKAHNFEVAEQHNNFLRETYG
jgi:hypothetical protein